MSLRARAAEVDFNRSRSYLGQIMRAVKGQNALSSVP